MTRPFDLSMTALARAIAAGDISAEAATGTYLERIDQLDEILGAYLRVDHEGALARARDIDRSLASGESLGPLAGVPLAIKDLIVSKDLETCAGSRILAGWKPPYDATVIARLRDAGAVILGKLNLDEFGMGSSNQSSAIKPCRNPWDPTRVPGGSSGGSAAAVAARMCAGALASDTGGSIRQPAAMCGVVGIKPTYGRVSRYGLIAFASSLDQIGPIAGSVADAALLLEVIAGYDPLDATSIASHAPAYHDLLTTGIDGLTIGLPAEYFASDVDAEVSAALAAAIEVLERAGATTRSISLPHSEFALATYYLIAPAEASSNLARYDGIRFGHRHPEATDLAQLYKKSRGTGFGPEVKRRIMLGTFALRAGHYDDYYLKAAKVRTLIKRDFDRAFADVDVILSPTTPSAAFPLDAKREDPLAMYQADIFTLSCNLAGLPAMSLPCGFTADDLPVGMQLIGKALDEATLLRVAATYEHHCDFVGRRPPDPSPAPS